MKEDTKVAHKLKSNTCINEFEQLCLVCNVIFFLLHAATSTSKYTTPWEFIQLT